MVVCTACVRTKDKPRGFGCAVLMTALFGGCSDWESSGSSANASLAGLDAETSADADDGGNEVDFDAGNYPNDASDGDSACSCVQ